MVDAKSGGSLLGRVGVVRRQIASELGMVIAPVRIHDDVGLDSHEYAVKVRGVEVARGRVIPGHRLAMDPGDATPGVAGIPTTEPAFGLPAVWIDENHRGEAEALGYTVVDAESMIVTHLTETIRRHVDELLTRQETKQAAGRAQGAERRRGRGGRPRQARRRRGAARAPAPAARDASRSATWARSSRRSATGPASTHDPAILAEYARQALARAITLDYLDSTKSLQAISLDPNLEQEIAESVTQTRDGEYLAMDPVARADRRAAR